jgi:hypothetical protein
MSAIILLIISISGVNSLLLPVSPIGVNTGFSVSNGAEAIFYNPANFESKENYRVWCSYNRVYLGMQSVSLAVSKKIKSINLGIAFINFDYGDIEWRPNYPTDDPLPSYSANDFSIIVGGSANLSPRGKIGLNLKYISESIHIYTDYALAVDLSFSYVGGKTGISFGASNFGTRLRIRSEEVNLPARLSLGGFHTLRKIRASADVHYLVNNEDFEYSFGLGYPAHDLLHLNVALHYRDEIYPGFGIDLKPGNLEIKYGGSFYPKDLGMINTIGIGFDF